MSKISRCLYALMGALLLGSFAATAQAAVTLVFSGSELSGARGVMVNGTAYDVDFVDGSCVAVFGGCDDAGSDFAFATGSELAASLALLDQVFLDGPQGPFDSEPTRVAGCEDARACYVLTPFFISGSQVLASAAANDVTDPQDGSFIAALPVSLDLASEPIGVYAVWTRASSVAEPATLALGAVAGLALGALRMRRRFERPTHAA